jgi:putative ABC transport system permease protein
MLKHILTTFYRSALSSKFQVITIVFGLTMGMVVSLLIYIYVREESRYDTHHTEAGRIYRVNTTLEMEGKIDPTAKSGLNTGEALMEFFPEVESATQVLNIGKQTIKVDANLFASEKVIYADSNFFSFFHYPFIEGVPEEALTGPNKAVISKKIAQQYLGNITRAIGTVISVNNKDFQITGIYDESAIRTHVPHEIFLSLSSLPQSFLQERKREYMWLTTYNYILLKAGVHADALESKLKSFEEKHLVPYVQKNQVNGSITFQLEQVTHIHLNDKLRFDFPGAINPDYLTIFSGVALLTLFIALINYINLTTAQVSRRLKEIGIKKSIGAAKTTLLFQFLTETVIIVAGSFLFALFLVYFSLPELNRLTDKNFTLPELVRPSFWYTSVTFIFLFGILAGIYPAILLSSFRPIQALQSSQKILGSSAFEKIITPGFVRKILVTLQFSISIFLIIGTLVIFRQFNHMKSQNMGFNQEQVLVIDIPGDTTISNKIDVIKNQLLQITAVKSVSAASSIPGSGHGALTMNVSQSGGSEIKVINTYLADEKFIETLDIELVKGRFFSKEFSTDPQQAFVINEAAVRFLGWDNAIDKKIVSPLGQDGKVVGVVKDFNYKSLHTSIEPLIIMNTPNSQGYLLVRIVSDHVPETVAQITNAWKSFDDSHPYEYFFLDEKFQAQYVKEERLVKIFSYFSGLAILISCLGLMGLAIFTNEIKTKEIAIRKTLGANRLQVLKLLSKDFLGLILLANVIAWPISWFLLSDWLSAFAYQIRLDIFPFLYGMLIAFAIALLTIMYFANRAASKGIVHALKYD